MSKIPFDLEPNECEIDNWALWYHTAGKKSFEGKLYITNKRLYFISNNKDFQLNLYKKLVENVQETKSFMSKSAEVKMKDGIVHQFDRGMLSTEKVVSEISQS